MFILELKVLSVKYFSLNLTGSASPDSANQSHQKHLNVKKRRKEYQVCLLLKTLEQGSFLLAELGELGMKR